MSHIAPWFYRQRPGDEEKATYRAWKRAWQLIPDLTQSTLFDQIEATDWDLLIILDAARYDTLRDIATGVVSKAVSPASSTPEFLKAANRNSVFADDYYLSANPQVERHDVDAAHIEHADHLWDDRLETIPPGPVYDRAAELVRDGESVVAHTVQPHYPHICRINGDLEPVPGGLHPAETDIELHDIVQGYLTNGNYALVDARRSYEICTEFAWNEAQAVAQRLRRDGYSIAITADHGEVFGEYGFVEHPVGVSIPPLRAVPWIEFTPAEDPTSNDEPESIDDRLRALGYR